MNRIHSHRRFAWVAALAMGAGMAGCQNDAQNGLLFGTAAGAGLGAIIGHQSGEAGAGAAIGAGVGALGGYIIGNESDKSKSHRYHPNYSY